MNLGPVDLIIVCIYFGLILTAGLLFKDHQKGIRDYFAAGGSMFWWMAGFSALTSELSVWGFTGAAGRYSSEGLLLLYVNFASYLTLPLLFRLGPRFRRLRVTTALEAVGLRFGTRTETFYSLLVIPLGIWGGGMGIHVTSVFFSAATGVDKNVVVVLIGGFITVVSALGGIWAVSTSDLFQGMLTLFMMIVMCALVTGHADVQAAGGVWAAIPPQLIDPFSHSTPFTVGIWMLAMTAVTVLGRFSVMHDGAKFILARGEKDCRKMVGVFLVLGLFMTPLIALPSVLSPRILGTEMVSQAGNSSEGVIAHLAGAILPAGLMGLMLAAIAAAAMNSMDQTLNRNAGFFVTSIYQKFLSRDAPADQLIRVSRIATVVSGAISIGIALGLNTYRQASLFDFVLRVNSLVTIPLMIPVALGVIFRRSPAWCVWASIAACTVVAGLTDTFVSADALFTAFGIEPKGSRDRIDLKLAVQVLLPIATGVAIFGAGHLRRLMVGHSDDPVAVEFWKRWNLPVIDEGPRDSDRFQHLNAARILLGFGAGVACLVPFLKLEAKSWLVVALAICFAAPGVLLLALAKKR